MKMTRMGNFTISVCISFCSISVLSASFASAGGQDYSKEANFYQKAMICSQQGDLDCKVDNLRLAMLLKQVPHEGYFSTLYDYSASVVDYVENHQDDHSDIQLWKSYSHLAVSIRVMKVTNPEGSVLEAALLTFMKLNIRHSHICSDWPDHKKRLDDLISNYEVWANREVTDPEDLKILLEELKGIQEEVVVCGPESDEKNILRNFFK